MDKKKIFLYITTIILVLILSLTAYLALKNRSIPSFKPEDFNVELLSVTVDRNMTHKEYYRISYEILIKNNVPKPLRIEAFGYFGKTAENLLAENGLLPYLELGVGKFPANAAVTTHAGITVTPDIYEKCRKDFNDLTIVLVINGRDKLQYKLK
ncbi:MAG: hypothetical protein GXW90_09400 [Tepidanaerobacter acetatoxydans]|uniref:Uncharacterized protein n=1 Tax=Tepidanaerobacter acetatoxydans (strain DSM 21804 / JCM 16047 / Re1) TaxID=1209989 RepID=F4LRH8_TEPAE|nr:hypothetical protein [Tepidanaerobacter acetatoxydans]AEE90241.1 hypothetical protein TepRe1_0026 [Tepidanaerobacter acetatoxydans Re1]NLU11127.1 hypothetical protein [Tepidanaerobacter acetatoxydans]CDI40258.1 conserved protein of unknown function [Tepidanaerobacter acetatoxydans Re1]